MLSLPGGPEAALKASRAGTTWTMQAAFHKEMHGVRDRPARCVRVLAASGHQDDDRPLLGTNACATFLSRPLCSIFNLVVVKVEIFEYKREMRTLRDSEGRPQGRRIIHFGCITKKRQLRHVLEVRALRDELNVLRKRPIGQRSLPKGQRRSRQTAFLDQPRPGCDERCTTRSLAP